MEEQLTTIELRVLGVLVEKQISTPDYYPMTLNALVNACNQKNNRDPVVTWDAMTVELGLDALRKKSLVRKIIDEGGRTPKFAHLFTSHFDLTRAQAAILCELMLRGPQTSGELKTRTARLHNFNDLGEVEKTLETLVSREPEPLAAELPRQPGTRETRFMHLLGDEPLPLNDQTGGGASIFAAAAASVSSPGAALERIANLETLVASLSTSVAGLQSSLEALRADHEALKNSPAYNPSRTPPMMRKSEPSQT
jgi:uncharacterized protein